MIDFLNIKPIEANVNIKDIKNATGLDFEVQTWIQFKAIYIGL